MAKRSSFEGGDSDVSRKSGAIAQETVHRSFELTGEGLDDGDALNKQQRQLRSMLAEKGLIDGE